MSSENLITGSDEDKTSKESSEKGDEYDYGVILDKVLSHVNTPSQPTTLADWSKTPQSDNTNISSTSTVAEDKKFLNGEAKERESRMKRRIERRTGRHTPLLPKTD